MPYYHTTEYAYEHIYDVQTLENYIQYADNDLQRMKEHMEKLMEFQEEVKKQIEKAKEIATYPEVEIWRKEDWRSPNRIKYYVSVYHRPMKMRGGRLEEIETREYPLHMTQTDYHEFEGRERHAALKKAEELSKVYQCEINRKGFAKK